MPMPPDGHELKRRARAAWGYSLLDQEKLAEATKIPHATLKGLLRAGGGPSPTVEQSWRIAKACCVPPDFMTHGWGWAAGERDNLLGRMAQLEERVADLTAAEGRLSAAIDGARGTDINDPDPVGEQLESLLGEEAPPSEGTGDDSATAGPDPTGPNQ